jgi:hypothetical protein
MVTKVLSPSHRFWDCAGEKCRYVPSAVIDNAMRYLESRCSRTGGIAYRVGCRARGHRSRRGFVALVQCSQYTSPMALNALKFCKRTIGFGDNQSGTWGHWYYAHLYLAQVMYLSGEQEWKSYFPKVRDHLLATQNDDGSWDGDAVGHVYGTAIALIILQLPYNNLPIMQR